MTNLGGRTVAADWGTEEGARPDYRVTPRVRAAAASTSRRTPAK